MKTIYLDHAATTPLDERVLEKMLPFLKEQYGNPSSLCYQGRVASTAIANARQKIANGLNCEVNEVIFTSGGTESDNLALIGAALANKHKGQHIITSNIEHHAVLKSCEALAKQGFSITYLPVDKYGLITPVQVQNAITAQTILVSIIYANNEIGTIEPVKEIAHVCKEKGVLIHTDACQAVGACSIDVKDLGVDLLTINGSKIYGPKGSGVLFIRTGVKVSPLLYGGSQEFKMRPGTENVAGIVGLAEAFELARSEQNLEENKRLVVMRDRLISALLNSIPKSRLNGHPTKRLPNNVNISFLNIEGESILLHLDALGISASTSSACTSADLEPSHVLLALGLPKEVAHGSLRLTLGRSNSNEDIEYVIAMITKIVQRLRAISAINLDTADFPGLFS